jgi:hypothetical protein
MVTKKDKTYTKNFYTDKEPSQLLEDNPLDTEEFDLSKQLRRIYANLTRK